MERLSGGEQQRVHLARVLAQLRAGQVMGRGRWLLLDEPTAHLDPAHQATVIRLARQVAAEGAGVVIVVHDLSVAVAVANRCSPLPPCLKGKAISSNDVHKLGPCSRHQVLAMADNSAIEWTDATWNPVTGCTKVSRGCDHCYAERFAERWRDVPGHPYEQGFDLRRWPSRLDQPARWRKPRMIFVNSMGDLFHKEIPGEFIDKVFEQMEIVNRHIYQVLTKRSVRMRDYLRRRYDQGTAPSHIWCGVSVEDRTVCSRIRHLAMAPASVRFLSLEPLLGPLGAIDLQGISWVIVGGESGPHARPLKSGWVRQIRDQCRDAEVPFFFKQWGGATPKAGGRLLEGEEYNFMPKALPGSNYGVLSMAS